MKSLIILISLILALHADKSFAQSGKKERDEFYQRSIEDKKAPQKNMFKSAHKKVDEKKKKKHYVSSKSKNKTKNHIKNKSYYN